MSKLKEYINENNYKNYMKEIMEELKEHEFYFLFNGDSIRYLSDENDKKYLPLYIDTEDIKDNEYTRIDKVKLDVILRDIFSSGEYYAITINPFTEDFVMNKSFIDKYKKLSVRREYMSFEKGLNIIGGKAGSGKSQELLTYVISSVLTMNKTVLFSLELSKDILAEKHGIKENDMLTIIDKVSSINDVEAVIDNYNIICIDYLNLLQSELDTYEEKISRLKALADNYNKPIVVIDVIGIKQDTSKYEEEIYNKCDSIYLIEDGNITKIK